MSLLNRLMLLVFLALVPAAVIEIDNEIELHTVREAEVHQTAQRLASLIEAEQSRIVEGVRQVLVTLGRTGAVREGDDRRCQDLLNRLRSDYPDHLTVHVTGTTGIIRCATDPEAVGFSIADRSHYRLALERKGFVVGEHLRRRTSGKPALPFALPYRDAGGSEAGMVTALLDLTWLTSYVAEKPLPEGAMLVVADRNGTLLASVPEIAGTMGESLPTPYRALLRASAPGTAELTGPDGTPLIVAYQPMASGPADSGSEGLFIAVGIDRQAATAPMRAAMLRALLLVGVVALLTLVAAWWGADHFLRRPLGVLADATRRWRVGDLSARTGIADASEIGQLARAFDEMADDLQRQAAVREQANAAAHKMAAVLASTTDGVFEVDPDWRITFMNDRARMLVAEGRDVVGKRLWDAFPDAVDSVFSQQYERALAEQEPVEFEGYYPRLDAWFAVRAFPSQGGLAVFFQDITARKRSDAALLAANREKSELLARHDAMLAHAPVGFAFFDRARRCIRVNEELARLNGLAVDAHAGRPLDEVLPGNALVMAPILDTVFITGEPTQTREILGEARSALGERRHWLTNVYPVKEDGAVTAVGVVVMEVTELRDAEAARRQSDERARSVFAQAAVGIERVALDGRILEGNGKLCAILGYTPDEVAGRSFRDLTHPADRVAEEALLDALLVGDIPSYALEKRYIRKDGSAVWVRVTSSLARITGTEEAYRISIVEDITERKRAEAALRDSEERLRLALANAEAGTWDWDIPTDTTRWSMEYYGLLGIEPGAVLPGKDAWLASILPEDRDAAVAAVQDTLANRRAEYYAEFRVNHPERGVRWLVGIGRAIYAEDGTPLRLTGINLDITGRKEMEQALHRAKEEAERANLAKTKFLAAASHDLRQPLQSLFFFAAALAAHVSPDGTKVLGHLERGLDALKGLLDSLLDVSQLDAGLVTPDIQDFAVSDVLDEIATAYAPVAGAKGLLWRVTPCTSVVRSDRTLLSRMVRNLIENALRYTDEGAVALDCRGDGEALTITVRDSGIGIPPDQLERIWEEFHQVGNPERDRAQGLGLGLAIVRRLSALLGHPVEVRSTVAKGSEFRIRVPLGAAMAKPVAALAAPVASGAGRFAVLVDDDAIVLMGLQAILKEWGYDVLTAGSADQALERLAADGRRPDIVVADYRLREGRVGTEAILRVRALRGDDIPGVILTGETGPECLHDAAEHRLFVVHKPVTPRELGAALERQMQAA